MGYLPEMIGNGSASDASLLARKGSYANRANHSQGGLRLVTAREVEEDDGVLLQVFPENAIVNGLFDKRFADAAVEAGGTYGSTADEVFLALDSVVTRERPEETLGRHLPWPRSRP